MKKTFAVVAPFLLIITFIVTCASGDGIHPIGENAVYIAGEACTLNMTTDRTIPDIRKDFEECVHIHKMYANK